MGKRGRIQRRHFKQPRENVWKKHRPDNADGNDNNQQQQSQSERWEPFLSNNSAFEEYYKEQGIIREEEWDEFISTLQKPLPATFRINSSAQFSNDIIFQFETDFLESLNAEDMDGNLVEFVRPLPWYPGKLAWHLNFSRMQLRKNQTLERIHEFLKQENEIGNITRQEAVSMVPPLFLDVQSHHYVLDMCAAPGSKTFQLLEMIHGPVKPGLLPEGMVIANDVDVQRCNLLIHQTKRMCTANLMVTNHEAQHFPGCRRNNDVLAGNGMSELNEDTRALTRVGLAFDRILCDVPCSGDGTIRKAPDIWRKWNTGLGNGVHRLQVQIALRGVALLKVGGKLVYSTCSLNPVEDEAVVGEVLRRCGGSVELLDMSTELPELKRRPGLKTWKVRDKGHWLTSHRQVHRFRKATIVPSMFPSGKTWDEKIISTQDCAKEEIKMEASFENDTSEKGMTLDEGRGEDNIIKEEAEVTSLPLERCMRILPHDQDTGGFFIAVFRKVSPFHVEDVKSKLPYKGCRFTSTQDSKQIMLSKPEVDTTTKETLSSEVETKADTLFMENNTVNQHDVDVRELEVVDSTGGLHSDAYNAGEPSSSELGKGEYEIEICQTIDDKTKKEKVDTPDSKLHQEGNLERKKKIQQQGRWRGVDPVLFFTDEKAINSIVTFYGIDESFQLRGRLLTRNSDTDHVKRIYYVSTSVRDTIELNLSIGQQLKITSVGLKMFERQTAKEGSSSCSYRISSEGLPLLLPYVRKQILYASLVDFKLLLSSRSLHFNAFQDPNIVTQASELLPGCCLVVLRTDEADTNNFCSASNMAFSENPPIAVGCWKGRTNLSLMVSKIESQGLLERICFKYGKEMPEKPNNPISNKNYIEEADEMHNIVDIDVQNETYEAQDILHEQEIPAQTDYDC